jgi:hypothetical protein
VRVVISGSRKYTLDISVLKAGSDIVGSHFVDTLKVVLKFPLVLESADFGKATEGDWSTNGPFLKQTSGYWKARRGTDGFLILYVMDEDDSGFIDVLVGNREEIFMALDGLFRFPPVLGETGTGTIWPGGGGIAKDASVGWRLVSQT